ncbi:MAG: choice-of-anchor D domain-containing protein [Verrucomicrobia bacterium]|nr:choice-of-anchor D domain-containing protein [Verrucomicrobiota bacterium]
MRRPLFAFLVGTALPVLTLPAQQPMSLQPGATVWDSTTTNWVNVYGLPSAWVPGSIALINNGQNLTVSGPQNALQISLSDNGALGGSPLQVSLFSGGANTSVSNAVSPSVGSSVAYSTPTTGLLRLSGVTTANTVIANAGNIYLTGSGARFNVQTVQVGALTPNAASTRLRIESGAVVNSLATAFSDNGRLELSGATMTTGGLETCTNDKSLGYLDFANSTFTANGDFIVNRNPGGIGTFQATNTTLNVGRNLVFGFKGEITQVQISGSTLNIAGYLAVADEGQVGFKEPTSQVQIGSSTISVADTPARAGIAGNRFDATGNSYLNLTNTTLRVRNGGTLSIVVRLTIDNLTIDTNGGTASTSYRMTGRGLIKTGAGTLVLRGAQGYGNNVTDGTIIRAGFIDFQESANFGPFQSSKNIQIDGGGLRWTAGNTTDISPRLRLLNAPTYDTNGNNVTFSTSLGGTGGMTKVGAGTLTLNVANTFSGGTTVRGGFVAFNANNAFGTGSLTLDGGGVRWISSTADITERLQALGAGGGVLDTNGNNPVLAANPITGAGTLTKIGAGTLSINGTHPWTGGLLVNGGTLQLSGLFNGKSLASIGQDGPGTLTLAQGTALSTTGNFFIGLNSAGVGVVNTTSNTSIIASGYMEVGTYGRGTLTVTGGGSVGSASTLALGVQAGSSGTVNVTGAGSSVSSASTLFVGYLGGGLLSIGAGGVVTTPELHLGVGNGALGVVGLEIGGTLAIGGTNTLRAGPGSYAFYLSGGRLRADLSPLVSGVPMTLGNVSTLDTNFHGMTLTGTLDGQGGLTKVGAGTLVLSGANTYAGGTTVQAGTLTVSSNFNLGTGPVTVAGGTLQSTGNYAIDSAATVTGPSSVFTTGGYLEVGKGGTGSLSITGGASVTSASTVAFGILGGGTLGTLDLNGAGSSLTSPGLLTVGFQGTGLVTIGNGATLNAQGGVQLGTGSGSNGTLRVNPGGTLQVQGTGGMIGGVGPALFEMAGGTLRPLGSALTVALPVTLAPAGGTFDTAGLGLTLNNAVSGSGALTKVGAGTLTLAGFNALSGPTLVSGGTLRANTTTSLGTGALRLDPGTTVELAYVGTATVQSLVLDGAQQAGGTWGSLTSTATIKSARFSGPGLLNVIDSIAPPTVNAATTAGLSYARPTASFDLFAATGASPAGGTFSGPGVTGSTFDPNAAGYGAHVLTYTLNGASVSFAVAVTGGLVLDETGGTAVPGNLAPAGTAFAKDLLPGAPAHSIPHLNDGAYGNPQSWIGNSAYSFAGVSLGATPVAINRVAFGRDNTGTFTDRCTDVYLVQYTTDPNPTAATTAWTSVGAVDYRVAGGLNLAQPERRHVFSFPTVSATGLRIVMANFGTALDEIEIYPAAGLFTTGGLRVVQEGGTFARDNIARAAGSVAFAKDVLPGFAEHTIPHLNDGAYGNGNSWIGATSNSFAGIAFAGPITLDRLALSRDNTGALTDRFVGRYLVQYTTVASPDASTPDASWTTIGLLDYQSAGGANFATPSRRHLFSFPAVTATGVRILTPNLAAIDELELYLGAAHLTLAEDVVLIPVTPGGPPFEFGSFFPGSSAARTFRLTNRGTADLNLVALFSQGGQETEFVPSALSLGNLPPGVSATYMVTFTPTATGPRGSTVYLSSNDPITPLFGYGVSGTGRTPTVNAAAGAGLSYPLNAAAVDLATVAAPTPAGGTFSGPGVTGGQFNPANAGLGLWTLTYTTNGASVTFRVAVTGGLVLEENGGFIDPAIGAAVPGNLAPLGTAFAKDVFPNNPNHTIPHLNDAVYGNGNSWIGITDESFAGVSFPAPVVINRIAFGRDNTGFYQDRCLDVYLVQVTVDPNPATATAWVTVGVIDYRPGGNANLADPAQRHVYSFPPFGATGLRIVTATAGTAIDELEIYGPTGVFATGGLRLVQESGAFAPANLAIEPGAVAFAKDVLQGSPNHTIPHLNDGLYGNAQSWIGDSANSFAGIRLTGSRTIDRVAFGRDNTGVFTDRTLGRYTIQYTTAPAPDASTPEASWVTIGFLDVQGSRFPDFQAPARRHLFSFPAVTATGLRILTPANAALDEIEIYQGAPKIGLAQGALVLGSGLSTIDFGEQPPGGLITRSFTVTNSGSAQLDLNSLNVDGAQASEFVVSALTAGTIAPGQSATFNVTFSPLASGARTATLHVTSNDAGTASFDVALTGTGLTPLASWRLANFGDSRNLGTGADTADPNNNGLGNLLEYALGGDPTGATTGQTVLPQVGQQSGRVRLNLTRYFDRTDVTLTVEAVDVLTGIWLPVARSVSAGPFTALVPGVTVNEVASPTSSAVTVLDVTPSPSQPRRFLRLRVTSP